MVETSFQGCMQQASESVSAVGIETLRRENVWKGGRNVSSTENEFSSAGCLRIIAVDVVWRLGIVSQEVL